MSDKSAALKSDAIVKTIKALQVEGITCLDCAQKFEKSVGALPESARQR